LNQNITQAQRGKSLYPNPSETQPTHLGPGPSGG
jgi:hypothetical protein